MTPTGFAYATCGATNKPDILRLYGSGYEVRLESIYSYVTLVEIKRYNHYGVKTIGLRFSSQGDVPTCPRLT